MRAISHLRRVAPPDPRLRPLALATLINTVGMGMSMSAGTIFLIRSAGLTPTEAGLGLTLGALLGLGAGPVIGDRADVLGAREVVVFCMLVEAAACASLLLVHSVLPLVVVTAIAAIGRAGTFSARGALIGVLTAEGEGPRYRSYLRALTNVGLATGTIGAAVVLTIDTRSAYVGMVLTDALTFVVGALVLLRMPRVAPTRASKPKKSEKSEATEVRWIALRDKRYLALTLATSIASLQYAVLVYALPLWVTLHTGAPRWLPAALFFTAAVVVAVIQVPATRSITDTRSAARLLVLSGPLFIVAWLLMVSSAEVGASGAAAFLLFGVLVHSLAEVWQAGGIFELSFALAAEEALGQYQGIMGLGDDLVSATAPLLVISLCVVWGAPGWFVLAGVVTAAGIAGAWCERMPGRQLRAAEA